MTKLELFNIIAIVIGPIVAVVITLWFQARSESRARKFHSFNAIWDTHHDASNALYSSAIRSVPIVFHKDQAVRNAWRKYMENVQNTPAPENQTRHNQEFLDRKHDLISAMANAIGLSLTEREIRESVYHARANVEAGEKLQSALLALPRIADALEKQASD